MEYKVEIAFPNGVKVKKAVLGLPIISHPKPGRMNEI
jgi:hypothetical protein